MGIQKGETPGRDQRRGAALLLAVRPDHLAMMVRPVSSLPAWAHGVGMILPCG